MGIQPINALTLPVSKARLGYLWYRGSCCFIPHSNSRARSTWSRFHAYLPIPPQSSALNSSPCGSLDPKFPLANIFFFKIGNISSFIYDQPDECEIEPSCGFNLNFPGYQWDWESFQIIISHLGLPSLNGLIIFPPFSMESVTFFLLFARSP